MRYGFALDQRTCIGCHACTVACKTEHEVPLGQFRTWVKYVDKGEYPDTTREFGVMRCNHCTDAPCVQICPTQALFKRDDGIVDFDNSVCIGCKACMQACPYDAIYIDADTHTAAKCNFCAHRVDEGLEPACVVVCPTHSIWVGDLDDPESGISRLVNTQDTAVRSPEQNTGPNVFYLGADRAVLDPLAAPVDDTYIWAKPDAHRLEVAEDLPIDPVTGARTTLNAAHPRPWGWKVVTYLWTKGVAAGALMLGALALLLGVDLGGLGSLGVPLLAMAGLLVTAVLLIADLKRPERFWMLLTRPNPTSWLAKGGIVLGVGAALSFVWFLGGVLDAPGLVAGIAGPAALAGALVAGYTGFLFGQAEGRDLWQSPLLLWHLLVQAAMVGAGMMLVLAPLADLGEPEIAFLARSLAVATVVHLAMSLLEMLGEHPSRQAAVAAHMITHGRYRALFWGGAIAPAVLVVVLAALSWGGGLLPAALLAGLVAQAALLAYESVFVRAGQDAPLS